VTTCLAKNQINLKDFENFKTLADFIIELMNTHFEQSYLQQIIDVLKSEDQYFIVLLDLIFKKFFLGRNCLFKNNDIRFIIKNTLSIYGPGFYMERLSKYLNTKSNGGARTAFQLNQVFNLLTFVLEISSSKFSTDENFKEKLSEGSFIQFSKKIQQLVKLHLADDDNNKEKEKLEKEKLEEEKIEEEKKEEEKKEEEKKENKKNKKKKKNKKQESKLTFEMFLISLTNYLDRLFSFERKIGYLAKENELSGSNNKLYKLVLKIASGLNYKHITNKLEAINKKMDNENYESDKEEKTKEEDKMEVDEKSD